MSHICVGQHGPTDNNSDQTFERLATAYINKLTPKGAVEAAIAFATSSAWGNDTERERRVHVFAALVVRHFAKVCRYRPARGSLFRGLSILAPQVQAMSALFTYMPVLRVTLDNWLFQLLGCQPLLTFRRLALCAALHPRNVARGSPLTRLPPVLFRRVLGFVWPERSPLQREVERSFPDRIKPIEIAFIFGHLQWSCSADIWSTWGPLAILCVEVLLSAAPTERELAPDQAEYLHVAGIMLLANCSRLAREPLPTTRPMAVQLGHELEMLATAHRATLPGFARFRIDEAIAASAGLKV